MIIIDGFIFSLFWIYSISGKHSIFGRVHAGMKVVKKVGDVQTDQTTDKYVKNLVFLF